MHWWTYPRAWPAALCDDSCVNAFTSWGTISGLTLPSRECGDPWSARGASCNSVSHGFETERTHAYGLPASVLPPFWHHHPELVWELSALHLHWLGAYDPEQNASAAIGWHRDFADARARLRDWVAASGTRIDRDRPTRQTTWPGEEPGPPVEDVVIADRDAEFVEFVHAQVRRRQEAEDAFYASLDDGLGGHRGGAGVMGGYVKKTDRRRYEDRSFSVRAVHRDPADLHKLAEVLIRLTLQETGRSRDRRAAEPPETYRDPAAALRSAASVAGPLVE